MRKCLYALLTSGILSAGACWCRNEEPSLHGVFDHLDTTNFPDLARQRDFCEIDHFADILKIK